MQTARENIIESNINTVSSSEKTELSKKRKISTETSESTNQDNKIDWIDSEDGAGKFMELQGGNKRVTVKKYGKRILVDIREWYIDKAGVRKPGRKGISLTADTFKEIAESIPDILAQIDETSE